MVVVQNSLIKYHGDIMNECDLMAINPIYHNEQENNYLSNYLSYKENKRTFPYYVTRAGKACNIN